MAALAVRAAQETADVAMMDLNFDQASLTHWHHVRGSPMWPRLVHNVEDIPRDVRKLAKEDCDWLFILAARKPVLVYQKAPQAAAAE